MKDLQELFNACGDDEKAIPDEFRPINIVLKIVPVSVDLDTKIITSRILIKDYVEDVGIGHVLHTSHELEPLELPIHAIELAE